MYVLHYMRYLEGLYIILVYVLILYEMLHIPMGQGNQI